MVDLKDENSCKCMYYTGLIICLQPSKVYVVDSNFKSSHWHLELNIQACYPNVNSKCSRHFIS